MRDLKLAGSWDDMPPLRETSFHGSWSYGATHHSWLGASIRVLQLVFEPGHGGSVHSGHCDRMPQTRWLRSNRTLFLIVLEAESVRLGSQHGRLPVRALFRAADCRPLCAHTAERGQGILWGPLYKDTDPILRTPPS